MLEQLNREIGLLSTGASLGEQVVDNDTLRDLITGFDESESGPFGAWVEKVTHIRERRYLDTEKAGWHLARDAANQALERAGLTGEDIPFILYCTFTHRETFPGDKLRFAEAIGATGAGCASLDAACAGSVYGLGMAYGLVKAGLYSRVMVVGVENMSRILDRADPLTVVLFGDGAGAAIVGRKDTGDDGFLDTMHFGQRIDHVNIQMGGGLNWYPETAIVKDGVTYVPRAFVGMGGGPRVLRNAVNAMAEEAVQALGFAPADLKKGTPELRELLDRICLVPHQANGRIVDGIQKKLGLRDEQVYRTIYHYGNMSSATNLVTLDHGLHHGNFTRTEVEDGPAEIVATDRKIESGDLVVLTSIGGGYLFGAVAFVAP